MPSKPILAAALALSVSLPTASTAYDVKDPRHIAMTMLGKDMKAINAALQADAQISDAIVAAAQRIAATAHRLRDLFPPHSGGGKSRAKPQIWHDWDGFTEASDRFAEAARSLAAAAHKGQRDSLATALTATGKACKGCHQTYRLPKKD